MLKIKYIGETDFLVLTHNIIYDVISIEKEWYRIIDDSGEDYLYPPELFEIGTLSIIWYKKSKKEGDIYIANRCEVTSQNHKVKDN